MGRKSRSILSFLESEGLFITRPSDIVEHLNNCFVNKVKKLRDKMSLADNVQTYFNIRNQIMAGKKCDFRFAPVTVSQVENLLLACKDKPAVVDNKDMIDYCSDRQQT